MKTVFDHIENIKEKPHHVRKKVVFGTAAGITAFIALIWLGVSLSGNAFAIQGSSFAESTGQGGIIATGASDTPSSGAVSAAAVLSTQPPAPVSSKPHIEIIGATSTEPATKPSDPTTIPF